MHHKYQRTSTVRYASIRLCAVALMAMRCRQKIAGLGSRRPEGLQLLQATSAWIYRFRRYGFRALAKHSLTGDFRKLHHLIYLLLAIPYCNLFQETWRNGSAYRFQARRSRVRSSLFPYQSRDCPYFISLVLARRWDLRQTLTLINPLLLIKKIAHKIEKRMSTTGFEPWCL